MRDKDFFSSDLIRVTLTLSTKCFTWRCAHSRKIACPFYKKYYRTIDFIIRRCANTNYKVIFKNGKPPIVIRIYVREKEALQRELDIYKLVADKMPVPVCLYANDSCSSFLYPYAMLFHYFRYCFIVGFL